MAEDNPSEIPGMNLDNKYSSKPPIIPKNDEKVQKEMEKVRKELEKLKNWIIKKYPFTQSLSILPPQSTQIFVEEEEIPKETEKYIQLYMIIPEEKYIEKLKNGGRLINEIKTEIVKEIEKTKQKIWLQIKSPVDIWENCLDSKFELTSAISMSLPLYDKGFLGVLRLAEIHKNLVLRKFERYVVSYVLAGSLIRGDATPTSDADVFIIINDTDVKKMPRLELKERLRGIIYQYVAEAAALAGVKNTLHIQTYLLTDFWEAVKDAHPVMFTFIRDGIPIYDRGTFMPWKSLLKMGKLKPSPESIDLFMKTADKTKEIIERRLIDAMIDVYYGVLNPSQALIMLYGSSPPVPKETYQKMEEIFVKKEKMLKKSDIKIVEKAIKMFKNYEHDPKYKVSGKEIDELVKESDIYLKKLKELRKMIEKNTQEKTIEQIYENVFELLKNIVGKMSQEKTLEEFEKNFVKKGKFTPQHLKIIKEIVDARKQTKKGKANMKIVDDARKNSVILINDLIEYIQRCDLVSLEKGRMKIKYKEGIGELLSADNKTFFFTGNSVKKITNKLEDSTMNEVSDALNNQKKLGNIQINPETFKVLKKEIGDFEIVL
ncbi:hypothetical protein DRN73_04045 [Candidatus Pacearchaeota archaeon]|nr:MAG: hypothetical protein DRN73_04045 [Candidatus Pacearchaeota archaeon]